MIGYMASEINREKIRLVATRRWLFELDEPVRYDTRSGVQYANGNAETRFVVVSWGRDGDTCIFPADSDGTILDMLGFKSADYYVDAEEFMREWATTALPANCTSSDAGGS